VTINTEAYMTVARPNITARWPKRELNQHFTLQMVSGEALPILNEVFLTLALGRCPLKIWEFIANTTNEFTLGLDILCTYDVSSEPIAASSRGSGIARELQPFSLVVADILVILVQWEGAVMA
jgi:hypothetical protein